MGHLGHVVSYERFRADVAALMARHPDVELHLVWRGPDDPVILDLIRTMPALSRQGLAEAAMRDVIALADQWQVSLTLVVQPVQGDEDTDRMRLTRWYERHGFSIAGLARSDDLVVVMHRPTLGRT